MTAPRATSTANGASSNASVASATSPSSPAAQPCPLFWAHGFVVDSVEWRWRPDFTSPQPDNKPHWVEYPDCQRHYLAWPSRLAPQWLAGSATFGAWCGNAKYAPAYSKAKDDYPRLN